MLRRRTKHVDIFLDSGAHSIYEQVLKNQGKGRDYSYAETQEFWDYVDKYAEYLKEMQWRFAVAVNVDVIFNAEKTWEVQKYLEDKYKLNVLPVYHFGEDVKWLKKYMDNYEYIGVGGLGQETPKAKYMYYADRIFKYICNDKGIPLRKIHGFAMTSPELMLRYPWFSVDSTTWLIGEKYGMLLIPKIRGGKFDYSLPPHMVSVTTRKCSKKNHLEHISSIEKSQILRYCKEVAECDYGESEFFMADPNTYKLQEDEFWADKKTGQVEKVLKYGIGNSMDLRNIINTIYFANLEKFLSEHPRIFKPEFEGLTLL